jgi:hypothetical protein
VLRRGAHGSKRLAAQAGLAGALGLAPQAPTEGCAQDLMDLQLLPLREREDASEQHLVLDVLLVLVGAIAGSGHVTIFDVTRRDPEVGLSVLSLADPKLIGDVRRFEYVQRFGAVTPHRAHPPLCSRHSLMRPENSACARLDRIYCWASGERSAECQEA